MSARDIIIRPIVTEKTMQISDAGNWVTFEVAKGTNKTAVALAVQEIYGIKPERVNIVNVHPKFRRVGRYSGYTRGVRKAMVKLPAGEKIDLFNTGE